MFSSALGQDTSVGCRRLEWVASLDFTSIFTHSHTVSSVQSSCNIHIAMSTCRIGRRSRGAVIYERLVVKEHA